MQGNVQRVEIGTVTIIDEQAIVDSVMQLQTHVHCMQLLKTANKNVRIFL
jgi:UDP-3-O-[3-hydroxymyristoyl] glucosamine N-acyltransferase